MGHFGGELGDTTRCCWAGAHLTALLSRCRVASSPPGTPAPLPALLPCLVCSTLSPLHGGPSHEPWAGDTSTTVAVPGSCPVGGTVSPRLLPGFAPCPARRVGGLCKKHFVGQRSSLPAPSLSPTCPGSVAGEGLFILVVLTPPELPSPPWPPLQDPRGVGCPPVGCPPVGCPPMGVSA